jgi:hypothetical protein
MFVTAGSGDEIWVAIATQAADGRFVDERLRDVLFRPSSMRRGPNSSELH